VAINACVTIWDGLRRVNITICGLDRADNAINGTPIVQAGDSGGPVFQGGSSVHPAGIISAGTDPGLTVWFTDIIIYDLNFGGAPETT
jgi:hypothetical protein